MVRPNSMIAGFLAAVFLHPSILLAQAAVTAINPAEGDPVIDFQIETCDAIRGFGLLIYGTIAKDLHLTDLCFDPDTGTLSGGEPLSGLELTKDSRQGRAWEDLAMGSDIYSRNHVQIGVDENSPGCVGNGPESIQFLSLTPQGPASDGYRFATMRAHTVPETSATVGNLEGEILLGLRNLYAADGSNALMQTSAFGDFFTSFSSTSDGAELLILEGYGNTYGEATGAFDMSYHGSGEFSLAGGLSAKNARVAGMADHDVATISVATIHARGHVFGEENRQLLGFGIVEGSLTTYGGTDIPIRGSLYLIACLTEETAS